MRRIGRDRRLRHLDLVPEIEGRRRAVEAGPEVRRRRGRSDFQRRSAASGSFSPWPVSTQTTRPPGRSCATPATPAAEAGSQKMPFEPADRAPPLEQLLVGHGHDLGDRLRLLAVDGLRDADRGRDRLGALVRLHREQTRPAGAGLVEPAGVRERVPAAPVREREHVGRAAELFDDLAGGRRLPFDPVRVDRVHVHQPSSSARRRASACASSNVPSTSRRSAPAASTCASLPRATAPFGITITAGSPARAA